LVIENTLPCWENVTCPFTTVAPVGLAEAAPMPAAYRHAAIGSGRNLRRRRASGDEGGNALRAGFIVSLSMASLENQAEAGMHAIVAGLVVLACACKTWP